MRKFAASLLATLALSQAILALPEGQWYNEMDGTPVTITVSASELEVMLGEGEEAVGFRGPVVDVKEPADGKPGRVVIGPTEGPTESDKESFEVLWFHNAEGNWASFGIDPTGYQTPVDAEGAALDESKTSLDGFMEAEYYKKVDSLPAMPALDKEKLLSFLEQVVSNDKERGDVRQTVNRLLIEKGYHPNDSEESLALAVSKYNTDPKVKALLDQLGVSAGDNEE